MGNVNNLMHEKPQSYVVFDQIEQLKKSKMKKEVTKVKRKENKMNNIKQVSTMSSNEEWKVYEITQYVWTGNRTSSGQYPVDGLTVASNYLPQGTIIYIDGIGERTVMDRGGRKTLRSNVIDVYISGSRQDALNFGRQERKVKIIRMGDV